MDKGVNRSTRNKGHFYNLYFLVGSREQFVTKTGSIIGSWDHFLEY